MAVPTIEELTEQLYGKFCEEHPVLNEMWIEKCKPWDKKKDYFAHAEVTEDVQAIRYDLDDDRKETRFFIKKGEAVLCTMVSRLGDVGIRNERINELCHGYDARVLPKHLTNVRRAK